MKLKLVLGTTLMVSALLAGATSQARTLIQNKGSDTLVNVAQAWAEAFKEVDPNVAVAVSGGGSGTGISAMINGTVDIANASRKMKDKEVESFEKKFGYKPVQLRTSIDTIVRWRGRYEKDGLQGLNDRPRPGRPPLFSPSGATQDRGPGQPFQLCGSARRRPGL